MNSPSNQASPGRYEKRFVTPSRNRSKFILSHQNTRIEERPGGLPVTVAGKSLPADSAILSVGVRPDTKFTERRIAAGHICGLNSHCHSGLRSYIACRILAGNGFECYNLAGGWRLYDSVLQEKEAAANACQ